MTLVIFAVCVFVFVGLFIPELEGRKSRLELFSPSKINLFLRVTKRREDGFHDLASLFHAIDLGDTMRVRLFSEQAYLPTTHNSTFFCVCVSFAGVGLAVFFLAKQ